MFDCCFRLRLSKRLVVGIQMLCFDLLFYWFGDFPPLPPVPTLFGAELNGAELNGVSSSDQPYIDRLHISFSPPVNYKLPAAQGATLSGVR